MPTHRRTYSTSAVASRDAFEYWSDAICDVYVPLDAQPNARAAEATPFRGRIDVCDFETVTISRVAAGAQVVRHREADARDDCLVSLQLAGTGCVRQHGRSAVLRPGDLSFYDATHSYELHFDGDFDQFVIQFPRQLLIDRVVDPDRIAGHRIHHDQPLARMVASLVQSLSEEDHDLSQAARQRLSIQVVDALATTAQLNLMTGTDDASDIIGAALEVATRHLSDPALSVATIARHLRVSVRTVQRAFAGSTPLATRIRTMRLAKARELLTGTHAAHLSISEIGALVGYPDPSNFSRAFRREHGLTPGAIRRGAN